VQVDGLYGVGKLAGQETDVIRRAIEPVQDYGGEIRAVLSQPVRNFPFVYYFRKFQTFVRNPYASFNRPARHLLLHSSRIDSD
ncbi:ATP-dependent endonuclease, partial [Pseudomonas aeruginosa]